MPIRQAWGVLGAPPIPTFGSGSKATPNSMVKLCMSKATCRLIALSASFWTPGSLNFAEDCAMSATIPMADIPSPRAGRSSRHALQDDQARDRAARQQGEHANDPADAMVAPHFHRRAVGL